MTNGAGAGFLILRICDWDEKLKDIFLVINAGQVVHSAKSWGGANDWITDPKRVMAPISIDLDPRDMEYGFCIALALDSEGKILEEDKKVFVIDSKSMTVYDSQNSIKAAVEVIKGLKSVADARAVANVDPNSNRISRNDQSTL